MDFSNVNMHMMSFVALQHTHRKAHKMHTMLSLDIIFSKNMKVVYCMLIVLHLKQHSVKYFIALRVTCRKFNNRHAMLSYIIIMLQNVSLFKLVRFLLLHCAYAEYTIGIRTFNNNIYFAMCHHPK